MAPAEAGVFAESAPRRRHRVAQGLVIALIVCATASVLGIVVRNSVQLGRMTTEVSVAQQRTTNLHNLQMEMLHLEQQLTELDDGGTVEDVEIRRGLVSRMVTVVRSLFPTTSAEGEELRQVQFALGRFPWSRLTEPDQDRDAVQATARKVVSQSQIRVKYLYDEQEKFFYEATLDSLHVKRSSENALASLVLLVIVLAGGWLVMLRRRNRSRLVRAYSALLAEVSERRTLQDQLSHQAFHDALTGLPNRAMFIRRLEERMRGGAGPVAPTSAALIDLDGFKTVNDTLGHAAGDELLQQIAVRLRGCLRTGDTVARLGGDEFALLVQADADHDVLAASARIIESLQTPIRVGGQEVLIGASIGIAHLDDQSTADDLLADADIAMYAAKKAGKSRYEVFRRDMRAQTLQRARMEQDLGRAIELDEIDVFFQPIVDLGTDRVVAVEALARWLHPEMGMISPAQFIPIAEESGLIREVGRHVLRRACRTVQTWRESLPGNENLSATVNVSVRQLLSGVFADHLLEALRESGLPPDKLTLEITESMALEESDAVTSELARIKDSGVRLAMDDFGAGYSSVTSLLRLQVDVLKVDRAFLEVDSRNRGTLIRAITELGHSLGLTVVAEGVATEEHLAHVRAANCDAAQGFLLARPMPEFDACEYLQRTTGRLAPVSSAG